MALSAIRRRARQFRQGLSSERPLARDSSVCNWLARARSQASGRRALELEQRVMPQPPASNLESLDHLDLVWGAEEIGKAIKLSSRQAFHLLERGKLPAKKVGGRWVASRQKLIEFFVSA
jgi:hypothetical protein